MITGRLFIGDIEGYLGTKTVSEDIIEILKKLPFKEFTGPVIRKSHGKETLITERKLGLFYDLE